ncbi:MAG: peptide chain release factor N(5)-glutamine methyltransferase [Candidatus Margulisbacteria bacterium]|nr:peptide chain release factor N(5)-glutamine methyltransferase [Candidatus Margulisiibacteriota bacterium]
MDEVWTVKKLLDWSAVYFKNKGIEPAKLTSQLLLSHILKLPKLHLFLQFDRPLNPKELADYKVLLLKRAEHEPLEYILGYTEFMGLPIKVEKGVLIPRPETEDLVVKAEHYISRMPGVQAIIDVGTGSGAIAIYLKKKFPDTSVFATDISLDAINVAKSNALANKVDINFQNIPFFDSEKISENLPLVIVTNPPYIRSADIPTLQPEVKDFEPILALDGGDDGLTVIKDLLVRALELKCNVSIFMEIGYDQAADVRFICEKLLIFDVTFFEDFNHVERIAKIDIKAN